MKSKRIKSFVDNFDIVISDVLDTDVIIVDEDMDIIGKSLKYFSLYNDIKIGSLIARVISANERLYIKDKAEINTCRKCKEYKICKMKGFIGVPIRFENRVLGVLALILQKSKVNKLFTKLDSTIFFMENMAELIGIRINEINEKKSLDDKMKRVEAILDFTNDALVYTDKYANIILSNKAFKKLFDKDNSMVSKPRNLKEIYKDILDLYARDKKIKNIKLSLTYNESLFRGFLSVEPVNFGFDEKFYICKFEEKLQFSNKEISTLNGSLVTFPWLSKYIKDEILDEAKLLSKKDTDILIYNKNNTISELLAKAIANYSDRHLEDIKVVYMQNIYRDLLDEFFMGEDGILNIIKKGTLIIVLPEYISLHIQDKLADVLVKNEERARVIFCTSSNIYDLRQKSLFSNKLYSYIKNIAFIDIDNIYYDYNLFDSFVRSSINYYSKIYNRLDYSYDEKDIEYLWGKKESYTLSDLEIYIESMVKSNNDLISNLPSIVSNINLSISEIEKNYLLDLIKQGKTKKEICEIMGISRSTFYRKCKNMHIEVEIYGKD